MVSSFPWNADNPKPAETRPNFHTHCSIKSHFHIILLHTARSPEWFIHAYYIYHQPRPYWLKLVYLVTCTNYVARSCVIFSILMTLYLSSKYCLNVVPNRPVSFLASVRNHVSRPQKHETAVYEYVWRANGICTNYTIWTHTAYGHVRPSVRRSADCSLENAIVYTKFGVPVYSPLSLTATV
jgi:hypothetical protein